MMDDKPLTRRQAIIAFAIGLTFAVLSVTPIYVLIYLELTR